MDIQTAIFHVLNSCTKISHLIQFITIILSVKDSITMNYTDISDHTPSVVGIIMASGSGSRFRAAVHKDSRNRLSADLRGQPADLSNNRLPADLRGQHADFSDNRLPADLRQQSADFSDNKLLADFCGQPLVTSILRTVSAVLPSACLAVTRYSGIHRLCSELGVPCILHNQPLLSDTIRIGLEALLAPGCTPIDGCLFFQADQPLVSSDSIHALIEAFRLNPDCIYRLSKDRTPGSPVLFPKSVFPELLTLPPDCGGNIVVRRHRELVRTVEAKYGYELLDVDTPEALQMLCHIAQHDAVPQKY